jgi:hypothetical protein
VRFDDPSSPKGSVEALVIPVDGPIQRVELDGSLEQLQTLVGGFIEALPLPEFICPDDDVTAYVNDEGKFSANCGINMRATNFLVPGIGLFWGDYIAGPMVVSGFDPRTGEHKPLPAAVVKRVRLIEREAAG